jgi:hypothetical protein
MRLQDAIREIFTNKGEVLTIAQVKQRIQSSYPGQWKDNAIATHLGALSVNTLAGRSLPSLRKNAFLFSLGGGRFRLWDPATDGNWIVGPDGVRLADDDGNSPEIAADEAIAEASNIEATISLERDMEANLVTNLNQLEPGLVLRDQQLDTGIVGRLDLLATDEDGQCVVIELKVGKADDRAVAQTMRYMGGVQHERTGGKPVRGILIAREFSEGAKFAGLALPTLVLKEYRVTFTFSAADVPPREAAQEAAQL